MKMAETVVTLYTRTNTLVNSKNYTRNSVVVLDSKKVLINVINIDSFIKCA